MDPFMHLGHKKNNIQYLIILSLSYLIQFSGLRTELFGLFRPRREFKNFVLRKNIDFKHFLRSHFNTHI